MLFVSLEHIEVFLVIFRKHLRRVMWDFMKIGWFDAEWPFYNFYMQAHCAYHH